MYHRDIRVLRTYNAAPYATALKSLEKALVAKQAAINEKIGVKESDTGLARMLVVKSSQWHVLITA